MSLQSSGPISWSALNLAYGNTSNALFSYSNIRNSTEGASFSNISLSNIQNRSIPYPGFVARRKFGESTTVMTDASTANTVFNNTKGVITYVNSVTLPSEEYFCCEWTGLIKLTENGTHSFYLSSDDGSELSVNNSVVATYYGLHGAGTGPTGTTTLNAGVYPYRLRFQEWQVGEYIDWFYKGPSDSTFNSLFNFPSSRFCYNYKPYIKLDANHLAYGQGVSVNSAIATWSNMGTDGTAVHATGASGNSSGNPTLTSDSGGFMVTFDRTKQQHFTLGTLTFDKFRSADSLNVNGLTIFAVARFSASSPGSWERIFDFGVGGSDNILLSRYAASQSVNLDVFTTGTTNGAAKYVTNAQIDGAFHVYTFVVTNASTSTMSVSIDNNDYSSALIDKQTQINILNKTLTSNYIGRSNYNGDAYFTGDIRELQIFREVLSTAVIQQMNKYLMYKWSITTDIAFITSGLIGYFTGESWTGSQWSDVSSTGNHATTIRGTPVNNAVTLNGFRCLSGGTTAGLSFPTAILPTGWTLFHVTKYNGTSKNRIFDAVGSSTNFLSGFHGNKAGVAYHDAWITPQTNVHGTNWVVSTDQKSLYRSNGTQRSTINGSTPAGVQISINNGWYQSSESSDWAVACVIAYNRELSGAEITQMESYLFRKYNLP